VGTGKYRIPEIFDCGGSVNHEIGNTYICSPVLGIRN
jgi:hypothetical protein